MDAIRWIFALLAIGAAAAAALWLALSAPAPSPASAPQTTTVAALPLNLPVVASAASAASAARSPVARAASATLPPLPAPRIGSEGYGPHIDRTLAGGDAAAAWEAVRWLRLCASNDARRSSFETVRSQGISPEMMTQMMVEADAESRRCQTVTAQHRAMLPELASRAMRAGVPEAASAYSGAVFAGDLTPAQRQEVAEAMRRDARSGNVQSLLGAVLAHEAWGLSDDERLGYLAAYGELPDQPSAKAIIQALVEQGSIRFKTPPSPEQLAAAKLAAQPILERARGSRP